MSIDTIRVSIPVFSVPENKFDHCFTNEIISTGTQKQKYVTTGKDDNGEVDPKAPRVTYYPPDNQFNNLTGEENTGLVSVEASLPKIVNGQNYSLINQDEINRGMDFIHTWLCERFGVFFPAWKTWSVSRLDGVWSWPVGKDMTHYLEALQSRPVHRYTRTNYISGENETQGFSWYAKSRKVNAYDKGLECGINAAKGLLRLEVQNLNKKAVNRLTHRLNCLNSAESLLSESAGRYEVSNWLKLIGMGKEIKAKGDIYREILEEFGPKEGAARWFFIEGYKRFGAGLKKINYAEKTYKTRYSEARKKGWLLDSEKTIPGLECPDLEKMPA